MNVKRTFYLKSKNEQGMHAPSPFNSEFNLNEISIKL